MRLLLLLLTSPPSVVALGTATGLAQHRVEFIQQIRRHNTLHAQSGSPVDRLTAALRRNGQRHGLHVSGRRRGSEALMLANIHGGPPVWDLRGLEHVDVLQAVGRGVRLVVESSVLGGPRLAVIKRNPSVCKLWANMSDKDKLQYIEFKSFFMSGEFLVLKFT